MFGIGGPELVVILVVALIFVGPDKLPQVARTLASGLRDLRRAANVAQAELRETVDDLMREVEADPPSKAPESNEDAAERLRAEARKKAAEAVAQARAGRGAAPPAVNASSSDSTVPGAAVEADPAAVATPAVPEATAVAADAIPIADPVAANAEPTPPPDLPDLRARRRKDLNALLAEEAAKIEAHREVVAQADADFEVRAPQPEPLAGVAGTVARSGTPTRKGSPASQVERAPSDQDEESA